MPPKRHAVLSASSSERWLNCPPSARLCEAYEDKGSDYAAEGTDAHALAEARLKQALGILAENPIENLSWYNEEMEECAAGYAAYVVELLETAKQTCSDPVVMIEQRVDFSRWVQEGFGTADCILIADGVMNICDYKHGKGVEVSAEQNPQMMLYALGSLEIFDGIYDIDTVRMTIFQPRKSNVSVYEMAKDELLEWADNELTQKAQLAYEGQGNFSCGEWCRFCKAKAECITAFVLVFPPEDENDKYIILPYFWLPEDNLELRVRRDHVPYDVWERQGFLQTTEGNVVHYGYIEKFIEGLGERFNIREIAFDRWGAVQMVQNLEGMGFTVVPFGQGFKDMSPPTKELMKLVLERRIAHGGHPVLRWMMDNIFIRTDPAGNIKPDKEKSTEKIDGAVATIMALDRAIRCGNDNGASVYDSRGLLFI